MTSDALDALLQPARWAPHRCVTCQALERIPTDKRARLVAALADRDGVSSAQIIAAFAHLLGYSPSESPIKRHRRPGGAATCD